MSKEKNSFVAENQYKEDFLRVIDIVSGVLPIIKRLGIIERNDTTNKKYVEMLSQDIKNLEATKKIILDNDVVKYLENVINEKTKSVNDYTSKRKKVSDEIEEIKKEIVAYQNYARNQYSFFERIVTFSSIDFTQMTYQNIFACIFMGIDVSKYVEVTRLEVERQKIFEMCKMKSNDFIEKLKEIL